jgi:hypothetical protein
MRGPPRDDARPLRCRSDSRLLRVKEPTGGRRQLRRVVKPRAARRGRTAALMGCAITLLLCGLLSCAPPNVAPMQRREMPDAAAPGASRDGGLGLSVPDADAAPADAQGGSAGAIADVACPLDLGVVFDPVNPVEEGGHGLDSGPRCAAPLARGAGGHPREQAPSVRSHTGSNCGEHGGW